MTSLAFTLFVPKFHLGNEIVLAASKPLLVINGNITLASDNANNASDITILSTNDPA
uniref:Uncharacterized protein n=1 Tax=uncultured marine virus TaxID=186617 RepID=A0A0F7L2G7_9VIRU|nr:hypothetical protein [uncultured marine virus]